MRVTITYRNAQTKRERTIKDVKYMGAAHAKAITQAIPGTINYPVPTGFRLKTNQAGNPILRPVDKRGKKGKYEQSIVNAQKAAKEEYKKLEFSAFCHIYKEVPAERNHRIANVVAYKNSNFQIAINKDEPGTFTAKMSKFEDFQDLSPHTNNTFNGRPAWTFSVDPDWGEPHPGADVGPIWNLLQFLKEYGLGPETIALAATIKKLVSSDGVLCVVYKSELKKWQKPDPLESGFISSAFDAQAGRDQPMLNTPLIEYKIRPSDTLPGLFPPMVDVPKNACIFTLIWAELQNDTKFQERYKELYAEIKADPYRWMWNLCFPNQPYTGKFDKMTLRQAFPVFDAIGKEVKIFDVCTQLWGYYRPPHVKQSYRQVICMLYHNEHVYLCNRSHKTAHFTDSNKYDVETGVVLDRVINKDDDAPDIHKTVSFPLRVPKKPEEDEATEGPRIPAPPMYLSVPNIGNEIARIVSRPKKGEEYTDYEFFVADSIRDLYEQIYTASTYEAGVMTTNQKIWGGLNMNNWVRGKITLNIKIRPVPVELREPMFALEQSKGVPAANALLNEYIEADRRVKMNILSPNILSQYSKSTLAVYTKYKRGGRSGVMVSEEEFEQLDRAKQFLGLDVAKHYPHILCSYQQLQVLSFFDDFLPYDGHPVEEYNTYEVHFLEDSYTFQEYSLCLGIKLLQFPDIQYEILSYIRPSRLTPNHIPTVLQDLWASTLNPILKKIISNSMSGTLGMDHSKQFYSRMYHDKKEAAHQMGFMKKSTSAIRHIFKVPEANMLTDQVEETHTWTLINNDRSDYHSGFLPQYHGCIDGSLAFMFLLQKEIESVGLRPIKRHCDNIFVDVDYDDKEAVMEVCMKMADRLCFVEEDPTSHLGISFITNKYEMFGRLKPDPKQIGDTYNPLVKIPNMPFVHPELPPRQILTTNEWDEEAMFDILDANPFIRLAADDAGSGKTCLGVNYFIKRHPDSKVLVLSYQNDKVAALRNDFKSHPTPDNVTVSTIDSYFTFLQEGQAAAYARLEQYDHVMVDEFDMTPVPTLTKMMRAVEQGRIKRMIITGDVHQLDAINNYVNNIDSQEDYYNRIKDKYFPVELRLKEIKRARCAAHQVVYDLPTIRDCPDCKKTRETARHIYHSIRDARSDEAAREFVLKTFKHVNFLSEVPNENLISYHTDNTRDVLNEFCHQRVLTERGLDPAIGWYPGQKLVCSTRHGLKDGTIQRNYVVTFVRMEGDNAVIYEPFEDIEYTFKASTLGTHYRNSHAVTCHSKQGASIKGDTYLFDIFSPCVTKKWLYVAISRNTNIWNNYIYTGNKIKAMRMEHIEAKIQHQIDGHRRADVKAGRPFKEEDYITVADVKRMIYRTRFCPWCQGDVNFKHFSIDRVDSEPAHVRGNCQMLCSAKCNSAKRKNFDAK